MALPDAEKRKLGKKYDSKNLFLEGYDYSVWSEEMPNKEETSDKEELTDIPPMLPVGDEEKVKEGKGLQVLTSNKLLTRVPTVVAQIKAGNNSYKLKDEIR